MEFAPPIHCVAMATKLPAHGLRAPLRTCPKMVLQSPTLSLILLPYTSKRIRAMPQVEHVLNDDDDDDVPH